MADDPSGALQACGVDSYSSGATDDVRGRGPVSVGQLFGLGNHVADRSGATSGTKYGATSRTKLGTVSGTICSTMSGIKYSTIPGTMPCITYGAKPSTLSHTTSSTQSGGVYGSKVGVDSAWV